MLALVLVQPLDLCVEDGVGVYYIARRFFNEPREAHLVFAFYGGHAAEDGRVVLILHKSRKLLCILYKAVAYKLGYKGA